MPMKKFVNAPEDLVKELMEGFALAHANTIKVTDKGLVVRKEEKSKDKVALVTLGGCGHEPALSGFVGKGLLDISVPGGIFAAPGAPKVMEALRMAKRDAGILFVVLNHEGDVMSSNIAMQMAEKEGIKVTKVLTQEDISGDPNDRRGLAACLFVYKVAGAAAEEGKSLEEVAAIAERVNKNMATLAVAVTGATHPATGQVISTVKDDEMEVGMGQHGEAGGGAQKMASAADTARIMLPPLLKDIGVKASEKVMVMINGVGSTTLMELYIVLQNVKKLLDEQNIEMARSLAGEYLSVQEMGGFQMCVAKMDDELLKYWDAPCASPALNIV